MKNKLKNMVFMTASKFSMIEIVLALIVVVIGIIGIIGLFPVGMKMQGEAAGKSYAGDAAEQFLHYNASKIAVDWNWIHVFADAKPEVAESWGAAPVTIFQSENVTIAADETFDDVPINATAPYKGLFLLTQTTTTGTVEFSAALRCWKTMAADGNSAELSVEISWPEAKPYDARDKAIYNSTVFHATTTAIETAELKGGKVTRNHGGGYTTTLESVAKKKTPADTYTIKLIVEHDGCTSADCVELKTYAVEAAAGTYTKIGFSSSSSPKVTGSINSGNDLGETIPFDGFAIQGISNIGNGQAAVFAVTYTLTIPDGFPTQQISAYNGTENLIVTFIPTDFQIVAETTKTDVGSGPCGGIEYPEDFAALFSSALYSPQDIDLTNITTVNLQGNIRSETATAGVNNISGAFKLTGNIEARTKITVQGTGTGSVISGNCITDTSGMLMVKNITVLGDTKKGDIGTLSLPVITAPTGTDDTENYQAPIVMISGDYTISGNYTLAGTLYVDGKLHINSGAVFSGTGALVASGAIHFNNYTGAVGGDIFVCSLGAGVKGGIHINQCSDLIINGTLYTAEDTVHINNVKGAKGKDVPGKVTITGGIYSGSKLTLNNIDNLTVGSAMALGIPPAICASLQ